jgi:hypothetical protein
MFLLKNLVDGEEWWADDVTSFCLNAAASYQKGTYASSKTSQVSHSP